MNKKYTAKKSLARLRKFVIEYCQEAAHHEDKTVPDMTLEERVEDLKLYLDLSEQE